MSVTFIYAVVIPLFAWSCHAEARRVDFSVHEDYSLWMASSPKIIPLPGGEDGIGFDDFRFSTLLGRLIVPAGRTGHLFLVDPETAAIETITGFSPTAGYYGRHGEGTTSADYGEGVLFAIDRTTRKLVVVDPKSGEVVAEVKLEGGPDYVRYVAPTHEVWVTDPSAEVIEVFLVGPDPRGPPQHTTTITVAGGPESLIIDGVRGRAYTHLWQGSTVAIDLASHELVARFPNGCTGSRGIALDEARGFLFVSCDEGVTAVLDLNHEGRMVSNVRTGKGVDLIDYDSRGSRLFVPGSESGTLSVLEVGENGGLTLLGDLPIPRGCHGVAADRAGRAFVGDPSGGRLLVVRLPSSVVPR